MKQYLAATFAAALATPLHAGSLLSQFDSFYVLGDSLSDNGNTFNLLQRAGLSPTSRALQQEGVSSDSFTWAKEFTDVFGPNGENLSFGAARANDNGDIIPDLFAQISAEPEAVPFLNKYQDGLGGLAARIGDGSDRELVTVFIGGNDFLDAAEATGAKLQDAAIAQATLGDAAAATVLASLQTDLATLTQKTLTTVIGGVQSIIGLDVNDLIVMTLPDFSVIPAFNGALAPVGAALAETAKTYNTLLEMELDKLRSDTVKITTVDIFDALSDTTLLAEAGFTDIDNACIDAGVTRCEGFLYFDGIHPASQGHALIAAQTREALAETYAPVPLPASALFLLSALGAGVVIRRRRQQA